MKVRIQPKALHALQRELTPKVSSVYSSQRQSKPTDGPTCYLVRRKVRPFFLQLCRVSKLPNLLHGRSRDSSTTVGNLDADILCSVGDDDTYRMEGIAFLPAIGQVST